MINCNRFSVLFKILRVFSFLIMAAGCAGCLLCCCAYVTFIKTSPIPANNGKRLFPEKNDFQVAVFGDFAMQTGTVIPIMREISASTADIAICTGDIFRHPQLAAALYLRSLYSSNMKKPYFCTPGNHDRINNALLYYRLFSETVQYHFSVGDTLFVVLDTSDWSFDKERFDYLEYILRKNRSDYKRCVIVTHTPPISSPNVQYLGNKELAEYLDLVIKRFNINAIICGHYHTAEILNFNNIPVYISSSSGQKIRSKATPYFGYLTLHFKADGSIQEKYIFKPELKRSRNYFHGFMIEKVLSDSKWFICSAILLISGIILLLLIKITKSQFYFMRDKQK